MYLLSQKITNPVTGSTLRNLESGASDSFLTIFVPKAVGFMFVFGALSFFFMLIWGSVSWILSGGDKASLEGAKNKITSALVGVVLLIASIALIKLIESFFNVDILSIDIGPLIIQ